METHSVAPPFKFSAPASCSFEAAKHKSLVASLVFPTATGEITPLDPILVQGMTPYESG